jgi:hypothetical protein
MTQQTMHHWRSIKFYFWVVINTIKNQHKAFLLWRHHLLLNLQLFQNVFVFFSSNFSHHLETLLILVCKLGFSFSSIIWSISILSFMHIIFYHFALFGYHIHLTFSGFTTILQGQNVEKNKGKNVICFCLMWWYSYAQLIMM